MKCLTKGLLTISLQVQLLFDKFYALNEWCLSGGDDRLSANDAKDKANSVVDESITIAKQVYCFATIYDLHLV